MMHIWLRQQFVPVPQKIMGYHTGNMYYAVVRNSLVLVYLIMRQIDMQQTCVKQYLFMFIAMYHVVLFMAYAHMKNKQYVIGVPLILVL